MCYKDAYAILVAKKSCCHPAIPSGCGIISLATRAKISKSKNLISSTVSIKNKLPLQTQGPFSLRDCFSHAFLSQASFSSFSSPRHPIPEIFVRHNSVKSQQIRRPEVFVNKKTRVFQDISMRSHPKQHMSMSIERY